MHTWSLLAALVAIYIPALAIPGPNFLAVTRASLDVSGRHGVVTALGVASGSTLQATLAAASVGLLLAHTGPVQRVVALLGGAYLLYMARSIWRQASIAQRPLTADGRGGSVVASYWSGLLTNLTNPKALVFFSTIFAGLLGPGAPPAARVMSVIAICVLSTLWHLSLATVFTRPAVRQGYAYLRPALSRVTAALLGGFGLRLVWTAASGR